MDGSTFSKAAVRRGLARTIRPFFGGLGAVLCLHRILPDDKRSRNPHLLDLEITPEFLRQLLRQLDREGYEFVSLDELLSRIQRQAGRSAHKCVVLTFDDGYLDNLVYGLPLMEELRIPFAVYPTVGLLDGTTDPWWYCLDELVTSVSTVVIPPCGGIPQTVIDVSDSRKRNRAYSELVHRWRLAGAEASAFINQARVENPKAGWTPNDRLFLNWDELRKLSAHPLVTVGSHTMTHPRLSQLERAPVKDELCRSKARLETELDKPITHLSYPFGSERDVFRGVSQLCEAAGYESAVTTIPRALKKGDGARRWTIPRFNVSGLEQDPSRILLSLAGWDPIRNKALRRRLHMLSDFA